MTDGRHSAPTLPGTQVVENPAMRYDEMYFGKQAVIVGEAAHLRWLMQIDRFRQEARDDARRIVRDGLAALMPSDVTPQRGV
jgi:hypothetical protein